MTPNLSALMRILSSPGCFLDIRAEGAAPVGVGVFDRSGRVVEWVDLGTVRKEIEGAARAGTTDQKEKRNE